MGGLRNELEPFWAWKWGAPERAWAVLSVKMRGSGTAANPAALPNAWKCESPERPLSRGAAERAELRPWEAMNGLKLKKFWKWWSPERQNPPKNVKWWCSGTDFFGNLWKWYASGTENHGWKWGSRLRHIPNMHTLWKYPPPPPGAPLIAFMSFFFHSFYVCNSVDECHAKSRASLLHGIYSVVYGVSCSVWTRNRVV